MSNLDLKVGIWATLHFGGWFDPVLPLPTSRLRTMASATALVLLVEDLKNARLARPHVKTTIEATAKAVFFAEPRSAFMSLEGIVADRVLSFVHCASDFSFLSYRPHRRILFESVSCARCLQASIVCTCRFRILWDPFPLDHPTFPLVDPLVGWIDTTPHSPPW